MSSDENLEAYGSENAPLLNLADAGTDVPVVAFHGNYDALTEEADIQWLFGELGDSLVYEQQIYAGHIGFLVGEDMSWFSGAAMEQIKKYHPQ